MLIKVNGSSEFQELSRLTWITVLQTATYSPAALLREIFKEFFLQI